MPGARKKSSANDSFIPKEAADRYSAASWVDQIEYETYYPKLMLEQRMNNNIQFRTSDNFVGDDEWGYDLNA